MCRERGPGKLWQDVAIGSFAASGLGEEQDIAAPHLKNLGMRIGNTALEWNPITSVQNVRLVFFRTAKILKNF